MGHHTTPDSRGVKGDDFILEYLEIQFSLDTLGEPEHKRGC